MDQCKQILPRGHFSPDSSVAYLLGNQEVFLPIRSTANASQTTALHRLKLRPKNPTIHRGSLDRRAYLAIYCFSMLQQTSNHAKAGLIGTFYLSIVSIRSRYNGRNRKIFYSFGHDKRNLGHVFGHISGHLLGRKLCPNWWHRCRISIKTVSSHSPKNIN